MHDAAPEDPVAEYVRVLRGFGLGDREIVDLHGDPGDVDDPDPVAHLRVLLDGTDPESLSDRLHCVLPASERGFSAPFEFWHSVPPVQLGKVLDPYGYRIDVDHRGEGTGGPFRIAVEDRATGRTRVREFEHPEGPLGEHNYPALVAAVEEMLDGDGPTFALLTAREARWRFVLAPGDDLAALRADYGDRVEVFGRPVLSAYEPSDFAGGAPDAAARARTGGASAGPDERPGDSPPGTDADGTSTGDPDVPEDAPDWLRSVAAMEGGVDAVVAALRESGPRTHVSGRTADDVLAEVPGRAERGSARTATGSGIDEVFEALEADPSADPGPTKVVSDRTVEDAFGHVDDPAPEDAGTATGEAPDSTLDGTDGETDPLTDEGDGEEADDDPLDSLVGADPEPTVVEGDPRTLVPGDSPAGDSPAGDALAGDSTPADPHEGAMRSGADADGQGRDGPPAGDADSGEFLPDDGDVDSGGATDEDDDPAPVDPAVADAIDHVGDGDADPMPGSALAESGIRDAESGSPPTDADAGTGRETVAGGAVESASRGEDARKPTPDSDDGPDMAAVLASLEDDGDGEERRGILGRIRVLFDRITPGDD